MSSIILGGAEINLRITKKQIKHAKVKYDIDLRVMDVSNVAEQKVVQLMQDPLFLTECFYAFYEEQLIQKGISPERFDDLVDETNIDELRTKFIHQCAAFFPFLKIISTTIQNLSGDQNPEVLPASQGT